MKPFFSKMRRLSLDEMIKAAERKQKNQNAPQMPEMKEEKAVFNRPDQRMNESGRIEAIMSAQELLSFPLAIIDTETPGLNENDEVLEIGIVDETGNTLLEARVKPSVPINPRASAVNGFKDEDLIDCPTIDEIAPAIFSAVAGRKIAGYNISFDMNKLNYSLSQHGILENISNETVDIMSLYKTFRGERKRISLQNACLYENISKSQDHRAVSDCILTLKLLQTIADDRKTMTKENEL